MTTEQLKAMVIEKVLYEHNIATLQTIFQILSSTAPDTVTVSGEQRADIEAGLADLAAGRVISSEELANEEKTWR